MQMQRDANDLLGGDLADTIRLVGLSNAGVDGRSLTIANRKREVAGSSDVKGSRGGFVIELVDVVNAHVIVDVKGVAVFLGISLGDRSSLFREVSEMRDINMRNVLIGTNLLSRILCGSHGNGSLERPVNDRFDDGSVGEGQAVSMNGNARGPQRRRHDDVLGR